MNEHPFGFTDEQVEALWESAWHWLQNWQDPQGASYDAEDCACCAIAKDEWCGGCPIYEYTERTDCTGTPFYDAVSDININRFYSANIEDETKKENIRREYTFLVMLALGEDPQSLLEGELNK